MRKISHKLRRRIRLSQLIICHFAVSAGILLANEQEQSLLNELTALRDTLRRQVASRLDAALKIEAPTVFYLNFERGFGRKPMAVHLERRGGAWQSVEFITSAKPDDIIAVETAALAWDGDLLKGDLVVKWNQEEGDEEETDNAESEEEAAYGTQTFTLDARREDLPRNLIVVFHRLVGGADWSLRYEPLKSGGWRFAGYETVPKAFSSWGPFEINVPDLIPDQDGYFDAVISLEYKGEESRLAEAYRQGEPVRLNFSGRVFEGRIDSRYSFQAPGGKHVLSSSHDLCEGFVRENMIEGRYRAHGTAGEWLGTLAGPWLPGVTGLNPVDILESGEKEMDRTVLAAVVYRQVLALSKLLSNESRSPADVVNRTHVAEPEWNDTNDAERLLYLNKLLWYARDAANPQGVSIPDEAESEELQDEWFGPFSQTARLPAGNVVPASGEGGWFVVDEWRVSGPFGIPDHSEPVLFPGVMPVYSAEWRRVRIFDDSTTARRGAVINVEDSAVWRAVDLEQNKVMPPADKAASSGAMRYFCWYAATTLRSGSARKVWLSLRVEGQVQLWLNGKLAAVCPPDRKKIGPALFEIDLQKGENTLLMRVAGSPESNDHYNRLHWFDGYGPRPLGRAEFTSVEVYVGSDVAPGKENVVSKAAASAATAGFRLDGTGRYPDAQPPLAWDLQQGINVEWQKPIPFGQTSPVVVDDHLLLACEPHLLLCLDAETGEELWRRQLDILQTFAECPAVDGIQGDLLEAYHSHLMVSADLKKELKNASGTQVALLQDRMAAEQAVWHEFAKWLNKHGIPVRDTAWTSPLVADGRVWVHFGTGVVGCYEVESGRQIWLQPTGYVWSQPNMGSPLLHDGLLILQTHLGSEAEDQFGLLALDAESGEKRWEAKGIEKRVRVAHDRPAGLGNGTALMVLTNAMHRKALVITGDGAVIDANDGRVIMRDILRIEANRAAPLVEGDIVYFSPALGTEAIRLALDDQGRVLARSLYSIRRRTGRGQAKTITQWGAQHWMPEPLLYDGRLFVSRVDTSHVPQHYPVPWHEISVYDAGSGEQLQRIRAVMRECTDPTVAPVMAGKVIMATDGGAPVAGFHGTTEYGQVAVLNSGDPTKLLLRNRIPPTRSHPVCSGDRLYLRSFGSLACVRIKDATGKEYQEKKMARLILDEIGVRPVQRTVLDVIGFSADQPYEETALSAVKHDRMPQNWLVAGPFPRLEESIESEDGMFDPAVWVEGGALSYGGQTCRIAPLSEKALLGENKSALNILVPASNKQNSTVFFYTILESTETATYSFHCRGTDYRVWICGKELENNGLISLPLGRYPLLMRVQIGRVPPFVNNLAVEPSFRRVEAPAAEYAEWVRRIKEYRPWLERIPQNLSGSEEARSALALLDHL